MIAEGEFKKRIQDMKDFRWGKLYPDDVFALLDEARREYPTMESVKREHPDLMEVYLLSELNFQRNEWFLKWFGSEEKQ